MAIQKHKKVSVGTYIRLSITDEENEIGHVYLYLLHNDLHDEPYAYIEDLFVEEDYRGQGYGKELMEMLEMVAAELTCYKIVGTFRNTKMHLKDFYNDLGYEIRGVEFRKDLE